MSRPPLEVADLVRAAGDAFIERNRQWIRWKHIKVLRAMVRCRTGGLTSLFGLPEGIAKSAARTLEKCSGTSDGLSARSVGVRGSRYRFSQARPAKKSRAKIKLG